MLARTPIPPDADLQIVYPETVRFVRRGWREARRASEVVQRVLDECARRRSHPPSLIALPAKLSRAVRDEPALVAELCADVANMAMMIGERVGVDWG